MTCEPRRPANARTPQVGRWGNLIAQPWRNGRGITRELARGADTGREPAWRVSIAEITSDGEFSSFEGFERVLTVVDGTRLVLEVDGVPNVLGKADPFRFDGAAATRAMLPDGPVQVLNLFTERATCCGEVSVGAVASGALQVARDEALVLVNVGAVPVEVSTTEGPILLDHLDWLVLRAGCTVGLPGVGTLASVRIGRSGPPSDSSTCDQ
jgi:environmental stress-induced protein Ves